MLKVPTVEPTLSLCSYRVGEVCEGVRREGGGGVVLMVADGRQMEDSELVGAYSPGMVSTPLS